MSVPGSREDVVTELTKKKKNLIKGSSEKKLLVLITPHQFLKILILQTHTIIVVLYPRRTMQGIFQWNKKKGSTPLKIQFEHLGIWKPEFPN